MEPQVKKPENGTLAPQMNEAARGSRYYARQPILTADGKVFAYELLFPLHWANKALYSVP